MHVCEKDCKEYEGRDHPLGEKWVIAGMGFKRCPLDVVDKAALWWIKAYQMSKMGILPNGTAWLNETNKFIEIMCYIDKILRG